MGNTIRRHGDNPSGQFTLIRNDLIRRSGLTLAESVVLNILLSHQDGWEVAQLSIARDAGISRPTVKKALDGLVAKGKLIMQDGKRGHGVYHVNPACDFTAAEVAALGRTLQGVCKESSSNGVSNTYHKEDQEQYQLKKQVRAADDRTHLTQDWEMQLRREMTE